MRLLEKHDANLFPRPEVICMSGGNDHCFRQLREEIAALPVHAQRNE
jgi:hypothetical protein